ncbi:MAG: hypothetical protein GKC04_07195 [Methanomicrobiales archaeon]|nr:hypothetical protein [Methanomicrobiales archaeon]
MPLETALEHRAVCEDEELFSTEGMQLQLLAGDSVDCTGNATRWMLGFSCDNGSAIQIYEEGEWRLYPWRGSLLGNPIDLSAIQSPGLLYLTHADAILRLSEEYGVETTSLQLEDGIYCIEARGDNGWGELEFDAITGEVRERA